jgi:hypothetical protein
MPALLWAVALGQRRACLPAAIMRRDRGAAVTGRVSPLERRCLLALISLIRDRTEPGCMYVDTVVPLGALYDELYTPGGRPYQLERRNQRQAQRRALERLRARGLIDALALAWCDVETGNLHRWQGGGSRKTEADGYVSETPRWRLVGFTLDGLATAMPLEDELAT